MVGVLGARCGGSVGVVCAAGLSGQGYMVSGASQHVCFIAHLSRWMRARGRDVSTLTPEVVEEFLAARRGAGYVNIGRSRRALPRALDRRTCVGRHHGPRLRRGGGPVKAAGDSGSLGTAAGRSVRV